MHGSIVVRNETRRDLVIILAQVSALYWEVVPAGQEYEFDGIGEVWFSVGAREYVPSQVSAVVPTKKGCAKVIALTSTVVAGTGIAIAAVATGTGLLLGFVPCLIPPVIAAIKVTAIKVGTAVGGVLTGGALAGAATAAGTVAKCISEPDLLRINTLAWDEYVKHGVKARRTRTVLKVVRNNHSGEKKYEIKRCFPNEGYRLGGEQSITESRERLQEMYSSSQNAQ